MLIVTNNNQTEAILEANYEKYEEQNGAALQISFSSFLFPQNVGHDLLDYEVIVTDEDGHEYVVKQYQQNITEKKITATHIFYELANIFKYDIYGGTRTFDDFATWLLNGTGWTFENVDIADYAMITNYGEGNVITLLQTLISTFKCEFKILPNKVIRFAKVIGEDNDLQYRYKYNISDLTQSIDTTSLKTQIRGYGGNNLVYTYTSPLASHDRIGIRIAEPVYDDSILNEADLIERLKSELPDAPETVIEVKVIDVDGEVGDTVWIIHEELDLSYQTRILSKKTKRHYADSTITVGNTIRKDITDILVSQKATIDENNRITRSRFEQTNDRITMEVETIGESIATLEIRADSIETSVTDLENNMNSKITQTAREIRAEVNDIDNKLSSSITQTASQIRSEVVDVRNNLQSSITQTASQIRSEVNAEIEEINEELVTTKSTLQSSITQTASQIRSEVRAEITTINNNITTTNNNVASLQIQANRIQSTVSSQTTEISYLGTRISSAESSIIQQANQIALKVSQTDYNGRTITSLINQDPYSVSINADKINLNGAVIVNGRISGATDIEVQNNVAVGNALYFGGYRTSFDFIKASGYMDFNSWGDFRFYGGNMYLNNAWVPTSRTPGLTFGYSSGTNRLYVTMNGVDVGYIKLTTD